MVDKAILPVLSSAGLLPSALSGASANNLFDFSRVNPVPQIPEKSSLEDEEHEDEEIKQNDPKQPEVRINPEQNHLEPVIQLDEEDMDLGSDDELLPQQIVQNVAEQLPEDQRPGFFERLQARVNQVQELQQQINQQLPGEMQHDESFQRWLARQLFKGFITSLSLSKFIEIAGDVYSAYKKSPQAQGKKDQVTKDPIPSDNFERTVYWSQHPVAPHCKRHIYTNKDGQLSSILVCSDELGTRTYHDR